MTNNNKSVNFYRKIAGEIINAGDVKLLPSNDNTKYDIEFIKNYAGAQKNLLDLGSGTGLIVNKLTDEFKSIVAVEFFREFSAYIKGKNITVVNEDILNYLPEGRFELITMFGVAHHFNEQESLIIYKNVYSMLKKESLFILKNQFGIKRTKTVTSSEEVGKDYFAQYRSLDFEIRRLEDIGFRNIAIHDIYPKWANRWDDTHFYALVCER